VRGAWSSKYSIFAAGKARALAKAARDTCLWVLIAANGRRSDIPFLAVFRFYWLNFEPCEAPLLKMAELAKCGLVGMKTLLYDAPQLTEPQSKAIEACVSKYLFWT
jgi:hypothetical protein